MGQIKVASAEPSLVVLGDTLVNSMFFESTLVYSNYFTASGGNVVGTFTSGSDTYIYHKYTSNGSFNVLSGSRNDVNILVVGGGGASPVTFGNNWPACGGAGGGGVLYQNEILFQSGTYTVTVGAGGVPFTGGSPVTPGDGSPSSIVGPGLNLIASGGLSNDQSSNEVSGAFSGEPTANGGGGQYYNAGITYAGGGGGAGANGANGVFGASGVGGDGKQYAMDGTSSYYGGGGGGGSYTYSGAGAGGNGGGGAGGNRGGSPTAGTANTGGGAGGTGYFQNSSGKAGGSGIVWIQYKSGSVPPPLPPPAPPASINILPITASGDSLVIWSDTTSLTSSVMYDKSGKGNNALLSGSALAVTSSNGFMFNGTNNYLTWPTTLSGQPSSSYTLQYYGVPFSSSVNYDFFAKDDYTNGWDFIYENKAGGTAGITYRDVAGSDKTSSVFTPSMDSKQQIVLTVNSDTNVIQLYRNGAFVTNLSRTTDVVNPFNAVAQPFKFGFNANADATYFKGSLASVAVYNKVLSSADIFYNWGQLTGSIFS